MTFNSAMPKRQISVVKNYYPQWNPFPIAVNSNYIYYENIF